MKTLQEIFEKYQAHQGEIIDDMPALWGGDKGSTHSYIPIYETFFLPIRDYKLNFLEVGVMHGSSVKMWKEFFPNAKITGFDIRETCLQYVEDRIDVIVIDSTDSDAIKEKFSSQTWDIIVDDGDHSPDAQIATFNNLFPLLSDGGLYIIEDVQNLSILKTNIIDKYDSSTIVDLRHVKNRDDDILIVVQK